MAAKTALITGASGQTGSYLAEYLLSLGYNVAGLMPRRSLPQRTNLEVALSHPKFQLIEGDMTDQVSLRDAIEATMPDEIYNLAAQSFVAASWSQPLTTNDVNYLGFIRLLEAVRSIRYGTKKWPRIYQASSSEMFGNQPAPQDEFTHMTPRSPYGVSKLAAHRMASVYRDSFRMFIASGICFNHESPRRGTEFVTRKIARGVAARVKWPKSPKIRLGYLESQRDWGYAPDYARAMWMMLQLNEPQDFVIATGESHSVLEFLQAACEVAGLPGSCYDHISPDGSLYRPAEVFQLIGDAGRARSVLNWEPAVNFEQLVEIMVEAELAK